MDDKLIIVKEILKRYNQEHLIQFYSELTETQKSSLLNQILSINFEDVLHLYEKSKLDVLDSTEEIAPLHYSVKELLPDNKKKLFNNLGIKAIKTGKIGVITLAGGQGSRLGINGPKGTFYLDTSPKKSLFEVLCDYIRTVSLQYNINIPWYIMTSTENYFDTINFFEQNNYFNYSRNNIIL